MVAEIETTRTTVSDTSSEVSMLLVNVSLASDSECTPKVMFDTPSSQTSSSDLITLVCSAFDDRSLGSLACTSQFAFQTVTRLASCSFFSRLRVISLTGIDVGQRQQHLCREIYTTLTSKVESSYEGNQTPLR